MKNIKAKIISNRRVSEGRFKMSLKAPAVARLAKPGQFVMVKCADALNPLLRRPLSFHRIEKGGFELLYQVIGTGTGALSKRKAGERLDIIGPLGNGFHPVRKGEKLAFIAGGIGVAPLLALAEECAAKSTRFTTLIGAKTKNHVLCEDEFKRLGAKVKVATEDGSMGHKGLVTELLARHCEGAKRPKQSGPRLLRGVYTERSECASNDEGAKPTTIYACGPHKMMKAVADTARKNRIMCFVSFEEKMACGTGACLGCAVKTLIGYKMACKDGPVFKSGDIIW